MKVQQSDSARPLTRRRWLRGSSVLLGLLAAAAGRARAAVDNPERTAAEFVTPEAQKSIDRGLAHPPVGIAPGLRQCVFGRGRAVAACGGAVLVVMLTGMGHDGLAGTRDVIAAGGAALAQDEATSVVWGMPGAIAQAGLCHKILPLPRLAGATLELLKGGRP